MVAFNPYHALRNNHSHDIDKAVSSSDLCDLLLTACEVMQYFAGELLYTNTPVLPFTQCLSAPSDGDRSLISSIVCGVCANPSCVCPCTHNHSIPGYNFAPVSADDGPLASVVLTQLTARDNKIQQRHASARWKNIYICLHRIEGSVVLYGRLLWL